MAVKDFLFNSKQNIDKVIYIKSDSFTIPNPTAGYYYTIAHGLPFIPLVEGSWSTSPDFTTNYDYGTGVIPSSNVTASIYDFSLEIAADATNIYIIPTNVSGSAQTVYVRIYGLQPSDSTADTSYTANSADSFSFNTKYNYLKQYDVGIVTGVTSGSTNTVNHSTGIVPQVKVWATNTAININSIFFANVRYPIYLTSFPTTTINDASVAVSSSSLTFKTGSSSNVERFDYRIYYDEAGA